MARTAAPRKRTRTPGDDGTRLTACNNATLNDKKPEKNN